MPVGAIYSAGSGGWRIYTGTIERQIQQRSSESGSESSGLSR